MKGREIYFVAMFMLFLVLFFTFISLNTINDNVIVPFTVGISTVSRWVLTALGYDVQQKGTILYTDNFGVNIKNGCNGVEAMSILLAAVLAFPASWKSKAIGLMGGIIVVQVINLIRIVILYLTGLHFPSFFHTSHTVIWQSIVIGVALLFWLYWAIKVKNERDKTIST